MATNSKRDYYEILEVERDADQQAIKQKYRKLALKYHPDRNSGDTESESKFKEISEAYQVLSDPTKRQKYDQFGHQGLNGSGFQPFTGFDEIFESFGDIFGDFFGGARRNRSRAMAGEDLRYDLTIEFMDSVRGVEKEIEVEKLTLCEDMQRQRIPSRIHSDCLSQLRWERSTPRDLKVFLCCPHPAPDVTELDR